MDRVLSLIEHYRYLVILFGVMLESTGVPLPGETILIASGVLVQRGHLDLGDVIVFGILGAVLGDQIGYWVGRGGGRPFVLRWGRYVFITPARLGRAEAFFERHGGKAVFLARFFSGLRVFGALVAGISRMRWGTFILYNALGGAVWATAVVLLGYFLGSSIGLVERWLGRATLVLVAMLAVVVAFYLAYRWAARNRARLAGWGEALLAYPPVARLRTRYDAQLRWQLRRLTPGQYLGLHLTVGLLAAAGCLWLFGGLVEDLLTGDPIVRFDQALPFFEHPLLTETSYSFPSGHAMESFVVYGMLAYFAVLALRTWKARVGVVCGAGLLVVLIGLSRMYLGVHYFSDVLAGYAAGGEWLSSLITGVETIRRSKMEAKTGG